MLPLEDDDLIGVYYHKPTDKVIGLVSTLGKELLKVQLEPIQKPIWGNILICDKKQVDIINKQSITGEVEWLKIPKFFIGKLHD